jgi:hypothetical protein
LSGRPGKPRAAVCVENIVALHHVFEYCPPVISFFCFPRFVFAYLLLSFFLSFFSFFLSFLSFFSFFLYLFISICFTFLLFSSPPRPACFWARPATYPCH